MVTYEQHVMIRVKAHSAGKEEWACPICGRRVLVHTEPAYAITVLAVGDEQATHCGGAGAPSAAPLAAEAVERAEGGADGDELSLEMLRPWLKALKAIEDEGLGRQ